MCGKTVLLQVDKDPVNRCDPQLIDLFGAKPPPHTAPSKAFYMPQLFNMTAENVEAGGTLSGNNVL